MIGNRDRLRDSLSSIRRQAAAVLSTEYIVIVIVRSRKGHEENLIISTYLLEVSTY
jgi:hypothetical protein